jgi:hypothetical protein
MFNDFTQFLNFKQINNVRNFNDKLLDLVFTDMKHCNLSRESVPIVTEDAHHPSITVSFIVRKVPFTNFSDFNVCTSFYNFRKANFPLMYSLLAQLDWSYLYGNTDTDNACRAFYNGLDQVFSMSVPKSRYRGTLSFPKWYSSELKLCLKRKYKLMKKLKNNQASKDEFSHLRRKVKQLINRDYKAYTSNTIESFKYNYKHLWTFVRDKKNQSRIPGSMTFNHLIYTKPNEIVDNFAKYFESVFNPHRAVGNQNNYHFHHTGYNQIDVPQLTIADIEQAIKGLKPTSSAGFDQIPTFIVKDCSAALIEPLTFLFNLSLKSGVFPSRWKFSKITPIFKSGDINITCNYRPIALLSVFSKIFETALYNILIPTMKQLITERQHGFISGRSTNTNLACFTQFVAEALDKNVQVDCIYTDFSKAFDKINHNVLLNKLDTYGFSQKLLTLFKSYLTGRTQAVVYNGYTSHSYSQTSGVPQGSVLGPLLFLMYINDLSYHINCNFLLFADDLKIFHGIHSLADCQSLQKDLDLINVWCAENDLQLNIAKCSIITFSRKKQRITYDYNIQNTILLRTSQHKDLGVTFDEKLNFNEHINLITNSSMKMLGFIIRSTLCLRSSEVLVRLYIAYIRSKLEYCVLIWSPFYNYQRMRIEKVQRKAAKYIFSTVYGHFPARGYSHTVLLNICGLDLLEYRRSINFTKILLNILRGKADCSELLSYLRLYVPTYNSRHHNLFLSPKAKTNIMLNSPIVKLQAVGNKINATSDLFIDSYSDIVFRLQNTLIVDPR